MKIAFITDIHEDQLSLKEALNKIEQIGADEIVCLGDIIGYTKDYSDYSESRNARECLDLIKTNCKQIILGNHDMHAAHIIPQHSDVFNFPPNWYAMNVFQKESLSDGEIWLPEKDELDPRLESEDIDYLKTLPEYDVRKCNDFNLMYAHYIYPNLSGLHKHFKKKRRQLSAHFDWMHEHDCKISFGGHGHYPEMWIAQQRGDKIDRPTFVKNSVYTVSNEADTKTIIGIPPITRSGRSGFCIFDTQELTIQFTPL